MSEHRSKDSCPLCNSIIAFTCYIWIDDSWHIKCTKCGKMFQEKRQDRIKEQDFRDIAREFNG